MKVFFVALLLFFSQAIRGQFILDSGCGTWRANDPVYTDWEPVDTLKSKPVKDTVRAWVYDREKLITSNQTKLVLCPCGCYDPTTYYQYRVCKKTGIRQVRYRTIYYSYTPPAANDYEKAVDSLKKKN